MKVKSRLYYGHFREMFELFCNTLKKGVEENYTDEMLKCLNHYDFFTFHYIRYLSQEVKTPHRAYLELRELIASGYFVKETFWKHVDKVEAYMINKELYEMLAISKKAKIKLKKIEEELVR